MSFKKNSACRYCGSDRLEIFLSLGSHPPSNSFLRADQVATEVRFPLEVYLCKECALVQLLHVVPPETIFDDYLYLSSSSRALVEHYGRLADSITSRFELNPHDLVVDIGCNDGVLLNRYQLPNLVRVGVEPSQVAETAAATGLEVVRDFFSPGVAGGIVKTHGRAKVVTATNVFAHVDEIGEFVSALTTLLDDAGVFIIEAPYLMDMVEQCLFDTIYHEHLCYLSLTPIVPFLAAYGLQAFDVERVPFGASGPAIRVFVRKWADGRQPLDSVARMLSEEAAWPVKQIDGYLEFADQVTSVKKRLLGLMERIRIEGSAIGGFGAPAKGNTLLNYLGLTSATVECIADNNRLKQGTLTPGSHIPIVSDAELLKRMPEYALLLSWNYLDFFLERSEYIREGGRFIVPLPEPRIVP